MYLTALHKFVFFGKVMPGLVGNFANEFNELQRIFSEKSWEMSQPKY